LALGPSKGLILADLQDCFITVLSPAAKRQKTRYDWNIWNVLPPEEDLFLHNTGVREAAAQKFYAEFSACVENGERFAILDMVNDPAALTGGRRDDRRYLSGETASLL
jgi:hypothetical protein